MIDQVQLVVVSDIHAHTWKAFSDGSGANNTRLKQTLSVVRETLQKARELDGLWLCTGDIIHSTGFAYHEVSSALIDLLNEFPDVKKIGIAGNHDGRGQGGEVFLEETFWFTLEHSVDNLHVLDKEYIVTDPGLTIWGFPAQNDTDIVERQVKELVEDPPADVILYHQMVSGASFPSGMTTDHGMDPEFLRKYARLSVLGDIHKPHLDIESDRAILIPGSPEQHNFGDKGSRGYWVVTMERQQDGWLPVDFEDIESDSPRFITVEHPSEVKDDGNYYRVLGGGDEDIPENAVAVKGSPDVVESRDLLDGAHSQREILKRWTELNPPEGRFVNRYLKTGLDVLQRQDDIVPRDARVRRVEGENFFSYKDFSYDVRDGVRLIVGRSNYYDSNGCLIGSTQIDVPRDFKKDPGGIPIEDLVGKQPLVYAFDIENKKFKVVRSEGVYKTGENKKVYKVTFSKDGRLSKMMTHDHIIGTYDHPILLMDGTYKKLGELESGDRIRPRRRRIRDSDYTVLVQSEANQIKRENHRVESVEFYGYEDVYDITVPEYHNFVANDIVVHNSGKSSLLEALFWALFGKTTKGVSASDVIRWGADKCRVQVEIDLEGRDLVIERSRTEHSINLQVWIDGDEVTAETNTALSDKLEGILGWTPKLFKALGYFSQEDLVLLSRSTDSELKTILADLRGLSAYQDAAEEVGNLAREATSDVNKYTSKVATLTEEIERDDARLEKQKKEAREWEESHEKAITQLDQKINELNKNKTQVSEKLDEQLNRIIDRASRLVDQAKKKRDVLYTQKVEEHRETILAGTEDELDTYKGKVAICEDVLEDCDCTEEDFTKKIDHIKSEIRSLSNELDQHKKTLKERQREANKYEKKIDHLQKELETISEDPEKRCPTCGQLVSSGESKEQLKTKIQEDINEYTKKLEKARQEIQAIPGIRSNVKGAKETKQDKLKDLQDKRDVLKKKKDLESRIKSLEDKIENAEETAKARADRDADSWLSQRKQHIRDRFSRVKDEVESRKRDLQKALNSLKNERDKEKARTNPHTESIKSTKESITERRSGRWRAHRRCREAEVREEIYSYWQEAFGKSGIQSLLIEDITALFNKHRTEVFPTLTRGKYDVQMSAVSETQAGEKREKAEYRVFQEGEEVPYEALSGGQRRRVDLGVLLTTTLAASKAHGVPGALGMLILDEVASYLDEDGAEALAETLGEYCPEIVPSVFVISQDTSHKALYNNTILVEQDEQGISKVVN